MLLNEHKSKLLFEKANVPVPQGIAVFPGEENDFNPDFPLPWFLKSQVLTGGRGKAGGILRIDDAADFPETARKLFDLKIKGHDIPFIRVEPGASIGREFYLSLTVSRERRCILLTVGREGGVEIENLGAENLLVQEIHLPGGLAPNQIRAAFFHLGLEKELLKDFAALLTSLFNGMLDNGLLMAEINPLIITTDNEFMALDGKVEIDDNYAEINPAMEDYYQREHASAEENEARDAGLSFVKLPGWVGLMVNGAGLAMATMDLLNFSKLPASNFLDLGGAADQKRMETALELLFGDTQVKAIFINLFGGILSCEKVALAMQGALGGKAPEKPIVVRMSGKDSESGLEILKSLNVENLHMAGDMKEAITILDTLKPEEASTVDFPAPMAKPWAYAQLPPDTPPTLFSASTRTLRSWCRASPVAKVSFTPGSCRSMAPTWLPVSRRSKVVRKFLASLFTTPLPKPSARMRSEPASSSYRLAWRQMPLPKLLSTKFRGPCASPKASPSTTCSLPSNRSSTLPPALSDRTRLA